MCFQHIFARVVVSIHRMNKATLYQKRTRATKHQAKDTYSYACIPPGQSSRTYVLSGKMRVPSNTASCTLFDRIIINI